MEIPSPQPHREHPVTASRQQLPHPPAEETRERAVPVGQKTGLVLRAVTRMLHRVPLEMPSQQASRNLAEKLISDVGCTTGRKVLEVLSRSVRQKSKGKCRINVNVNVNDMDPIS
jgi:hypothetical protein